MTDSQLAEFLRAELSQLRADLSNTRDIVLEERALSRSFRNDTQTRLIAIQQEIDGNRQVIGEHKLVFRSGRTIAAVILFFGGLLAGLVHLVVEMVDKLRL